MIPRTHKSNDERLPAKLMSLTFEDLSGHSRIMSPIKLAYTTAELEQQARERAALMELSAAISGASKPANWGSADNVCNWSGFYCATSGFVSYIAFPQTNSMTGTT